MNNVTNINSSLLNGIGVSNQESLFRLGLFTLCKNKIGFAKVFFQDAASNGNTRAQKYLSLLENREVPVANWRQKVLDLEAKHIIFGEQ